MNVNAQGSQVDHVEVHCPVGPHRTSLYHADATPTNSGMCEFDGARRVRVQCASDAAVIGCYLEHPDGKYFLGFPAERSCIVATTVVSDYRAAEDAASSSTARSVALVCRISRRRHRCTRISLLTSRIRIVAATEPSAESSIHRPDESVFTPKVVNERIALADCVRIRMSIRC